MSNFVEVDRHVRTVLLLHAFAGVLATQPCAGNMQKRPTSWMETRLASLGWVLISLASWSRCGEMPQRDFVLPNSFKPCSTRGVQQADGAPAGYTLCYYAKCKILQNDEDVWPWTGQSETADCGCIPWHGSNWVDIRSILNETIFEETNDACGIRDGGSPCLEPNSAPVCDYVNDPKSFYTNLTYGPADSISDFSLAFSNETLGISPFELGKTTCPKGKYAGCMTAPCYFEPITIDGETFPVTCKCPVVEGVYAVGQDDVPCDLGEDMVWSAATDPVTIEAESDACLPDSPGSFQCPVFEPPIFCGNPPYVEEDMKDLCAEACDAASSCQNNDGIMETFLCDSSVCSSDSIPSMLQCASSLSSLQCNMTAILEVEANAKCSCCFESVCGCVPNYQTIDQLRQRKELLGGPPAFHDPLSCPII